MKKADIGMIGLAVMGSNLARNMESKGFTVAVYNREPEMTDAFMEQEAGKNFLPSYNYKDLIESIRTPRVVFMMIRAGRPVDMVIEEILPLLSDGDIIVVFERIEDLVGEIPCGGLRLWNRRASSLSEPAFPAVRKAH